MSFYRKLAFSSLEKKTLTSLSDLLLEKLTGGIFLYSLKEEKMLFHNQEFESLTGISSQELKKKGLSPFFALFNTDDLEMVLNEAYPFLKDLFQKKRNTELSVFRYSINYRIKTPAGKIKHLLHQTTVLEHGINNEPQITLAHISDISEYKKDSAMVVCVSAYDGEKKKWKKIAEEKFVHKPKNLSDRERHIMEMVVAGLLQRDIAKKLHISYFTVRAHCRHILEKTNCRSLKDLRQKSLEEGWT